MIALDRLTKVYGAGERVLDDISLQVDRGEIAAIVGPSGAGKSTLAKCINLLERPTSGEVVVDGVNLTALGGEKLRAARRAIGTIFQNAVLLRRKTVAENISVPLEYFGVTRADSDKRVAELLGLVGLSGKANFYPSQLSGGQQQRVGIARALALRPSVLLADEATSGLDPETTKSILSLLEGLRDELELTIVLITHEMDVVRDAADTVWRLDQGHIAESGKLADILGNPSSPLGQQLLPQRPAALPPTGARSWQVEYAQSDVPLNWIVVASQELNTDIGLLGASLETVHGKLVGRVLVSISDQLSETRVLTALERCGLSGRPLASGNSPYDLRRVHEHSLV